MQQCKMARKKINGATIRKKGKDISGRTRFVLEKKIAGKTYSVALNPDKLWEMLYLKLDVDEIKKSNT